MAYATAGAQTALIRTVNLPFGIGLMLAQQCLFTIDTLSIHALAGQASLWQIGEFRALWAVILALALAPSVGWRVFGTVRPCLMAVRVAVTSVYAWVIIWSFSALPLGDATALDYTVVLYVVLLAGPMLGEAVGLRRYAAAIVGIAGAVLVIRPGINDLLWAYATVFLLTSLNGIALCLNRPAATRRQPGHDLTVRRNRERADVRTRRVRTAAIDRVVAVVARARHGAAGHVRRHRCPALCRGVTACTVDLCPTSAGDGDRRGLVR